MRVVFALFSLLFLSPVSHAEVATLPLEKAAAELEQIWPDRKANWKKEDELILSNIQLTPTIGRMLGLARNVKTAAETDPLSKEIYDSAMSIAERYQKLYAANEAALKEIYDQRMRWIEPASLVEWSGKLGACGGLVAFGKTRARLRFDHLHPGDLEPYKAKIGAYVPIDSSAVLTISFHEGENPFPYPNTARAHIFLTPEGKAKVLAMAQGDFSCWVPLE